MAVENGLQEKLREIKDRGGHIVFSDGACSGNPGPGGWGTIVIFASGEVTELGGHEDQTTNNRMEIIGAISGVEQILKNNALSGGQSSAGDSESAGSKRAEKIRITVATDSTYLIKGSEQWLRAWQNRRWRTADGESVKNQDLWERVSELLTKAQIDWIYVPGHSGVGGNERCDAIAVKMAKNESVNLYQGSIKNYPLDPFHYESSQGFPIYLVKDGPRVFSFATWPACEAFVKGRANLKFKKIKNRGEVDEFFQTWNIASGTEIEKR